LRLFSNEGNVLLSIESVGLNDARPQLAAQRADGVALVRPGYTGHEVEGQILESLAEGALAPAQIASNLRADEDDLRRELENLRKQGLVELSTVTPHATEATASAAYWRITDSGRAHLEQLRAQG
jgi:hypothetical protein